MIRDRSLGRRNALENKIKYSSELDAIDEDKMLADALDLTTAFSVFGRNPFGIRERAISTALSSFPLKRLNGFVSLFNFEFQNGPSLQGASSLSGTHILRQYIEQSCTGIASAVLIQDVLQPTEPAFKLSF